MALFEAVRAVIFRGGDWTLNKVKETTGRNGGTKESTKCSSITPTLASRPIQQVNIEIIFLWKVHGIQVQRFHCNDLNIDHHLKIEQCPFSKFIFYFSRD